MNNFSDGSNNCRFVCPNDRQLALRAKLKTGWSVKTASLNYYGNSTPTTTSRPLDAEEQAAIFNVIKRAEEVDLTEQERVGKLVDKLENMRRNVLGRNASQCLLCGDGFGMLGAQKIICIDCKRLVCHKCSIETSSVMANAPAKNLRNSWLCLICAETREIWKKSGAWFFKSIPKYILPSDPKKSVRGAQTGRNSKQMSSYGGEEDNSSDEDRKFWNRNKRKHSTESGSQMETTSHQHYHPQLDAVQQEPSTMSYPLDTDLQPSPRWEDPTSGADSCESRRESTVSDWNWSDTRSDDAKLSPTPSSSSTVFKPSSDEAKITDSPYGTIELSLTYSPITCTLLCTVYRAKNLIPMDINGLSDPFCKLNILPNAKMSTRLRTKTVHKTRNPEFNENLTFYDIGEMDLKTKALHVIVVDDDRFAHDFMGETRIPLQRLHKQNTVYITAPLEKFRAEGRGPIPLPELNQWFDDLWSRGQILLSLCYSTKRRALLVTVCKCVNLLPMDNNGFSDPFVKLQLKPDGSKKHKTTIKWKNLNPVFNEEFAFESRPTELAMQSLYVTVYDKDYGKSNDYLGGLVLGGAGSKGARLKQWLDMIRYPDHRHEAWHNLTEEILD